MIYITVDWPTFGKGVLYLTLISKHDRSFLAVKQRQPLILNFFLTITQYIKPYLQKFLGARINFKHFDTMLTKVNKTTRLPRKLRGTHELQVLRPSFNYGFIMYDLAYNASF